MYPELYDIEKFVPYFDAKLETLTPESITGIINASAVDIKCRTSEVVK